MKSETKSKKIEIIEFHGMMMGGIIQYISIQTSSKLLSFDGNFQILVKFLSFKGVGLRN